MAMPSEPEVLGCSASIFRPDCVRVDGLGEIAWWVLDQPVIEHDWIISDLKKNPRRLDAKTAAELD